MYGGLRGRVGGHYKLDLGSDGVLECEITKCHKKPTKI